MNDEYIKNLPKSVQNIVYNSDWEKKTVEIGKKYGLSDEQIDIIANYVVLVLVGLEKPEEFLSKIVSDLNISRLLAEQIVEDLENRVFDYALKQIEGDNKVSDRTVSNERLMSAGTQLELKPDNLPVVEVNEPLRVIPVPKPVFQNEVLDKQIPIGVPRYAETTKPNFINPVIEKKINAITSSPAPVKYEKDPYREPLS